MHNINILWFTPDTLDDNEFWETIIDDENAAHENTLSLTSEGEKINVNNILDCFDFKVR